MSGRRIIKWLGVILLLLLVASIEPGLFLVPIALLFGWIPSAARLAQRWGFGWSGLAWLALAAALVVAGTHWFLRWAYTGWKGTNTNPHAPIPQWRWKWTLCGFGVGLCTLVALIGVILTIHQVYWLKKSNQPWFVSYQRDRIMLLGTAHMLQSEAEKTDWSSTSMRAAFWNGNYGGEAWERFNVVWVEEPTNTVKAALLFPRTPRPGSEWRWVLLQRGTNFQVRNKSELPAALESYAGGVQLPHTGGSVTLLP